jgi:hypothetical protein
MIKATLVQVRAPHFCAGMEVVDGIVIRAAPILRRWFLGKTIDQARAIIAARKWVAVIVEE